MTAPPSSPLPFPRHEVFGLDLRDRSSLEALDWLNAAGREQFALILLPLDADVVLALGEPEQEDDALFAMDRIVEAAAGSPLGVCLRRPIEIENPEDVAEAAIVTLTERYPNAIAYVFACDDAPEEWQRQIADTTVSTRVIVSPGDDAMIPLSTGEAVGTLSRDSIEAISPDALVDVESAGYSVVSAPIVEPLQPEVRERSAATIRENPHIALVLVQPARELDPSTVADSLRPALIEGPLLPSGYSSVASPVIGLNGAWTDASVGTVPYRRTGDSGPVIFADFVGTDLSLLTIMSPDAGRVHAWIDPPDGATGIVPDASFDLTSTQAEDVALRLFTDLPGRRHRVIIQAENTDGTSVAVSGLFVSATTAAESTRALAALALLATAAGALTERSLASINAIREGYPNRSIRHRHSIGNPRGFSFRR
jgi:hypothetical protein